jgi:hypothetical protein
LVRSLELIDVDSGNLVGSCATLEDALHIARTSYAEHGLDGIRGLAILAVADDGSQELLFGDLNLLKRVIDEELASKPA